MDATLQQSLAHCKQHIERRLDKRDNRGCRRPALTANNIHYELAERTRAIAAGGIGLIHRVVKTLGLDEDINARLKCSRSTCLITSRITCSTLLTTCWPAAHAWSIWNCGETTKCTGCLGARRIPDPTTAGDFCRRFHRYEIHLLQEAFNDMPARSGGGSPRRSSPKPRSTGMARWCRPRASAKRAWTSLTKALGAFIRWWSRWPKRAKSWRWSTVGQSAQP